MSDLLLKNLEIRSFRGFRHLKIERLGRVNLIVGKNNVGKTALLEALRLYVSRGSPEVIWELLLGRGEGGRRMIERRGISRRYSSDDLLVALKYVFYGRRELRSYNEPILISSDDLPANRLSIGINWYIRVDDEAGGSRLKKLDSFEGFDTSENPTPRFTIQVGDGIERTYLINRSSILDDIPRDTKEVNCIFRGANSSGEKEIDRLWDSIALTSLEKEVLAALRIIAPGVEGLNFVANDASLSERVPIIRVAGIEEPLPLRNLGDGMQRMLGIALALVNAKDGMVLIDEIENGLHYSAQPDMWRIIFQLARRLNIQVFATSHSWDCIEAFQQAAEEDKQTEGLLIRLEYKKGEVIPTIFDERELNIVTREQIEVR